ncbi:MAG: D-amino-acid transaminase [Sulfuricaulis sp.]|uniref:D-amino-acid transaminase n=1 Tax=Sulfuricaulis sp. TaxID=2003553 RepID=UPI0025CF14F1|nr:D-amino-acid transaminase [Sulfuricaulis sp.]MCR4348111.1 D-amino-acid transaminase [Sulfuricaulis sp.]
MTHPMSQVYLNGQYLPPDQARVSVFDRGFIFGDGIYEVIPVFGGRLFRLAHHLSRLDASLAAIRLRNPHTAQEWNSIFTRLLEKDGKDDQSIYLQITRGVAPRDHAFPPNITPTVFAYAQPLKYSPPEQLAQGVAAVTTADIRWARCDIKAIALLANALLRQQAIDQGAVEAILVRDGVVTEGAASNIFVVKNGRLITAPKGSFILPGITRDLVVEIARAHGINCDELPVKLETLSSADEVWLTSSTKEILPITRIDDKPVGNGKPGPMHTRMFALYKDYKQAFIQGKAD